MARSLNKVMLIGNVGSDPEIRTVASGTKVAKFSLATSRQWNDRSGQKQEKTEWHRITAWDRTAELIEQYVKKGDRLYIEGSLEYSQTEGDDGKPRYWTDIIVREMVMLGGSGGGGGGGGFERGGGGFERGGGYGGGGGGGYDAPNPRAGRRPAQPAPPSPGPSSPFDADDDDLPF